jgi:hypothetical protein
MIKVGGVGSWVDDVLAPAIDMTLETRTKQVI